MGIIERGFCARLPLHWTADFAPHPVMRNRVARVARLFVMFAACGTFAATALDAAASQFVRLDYNLTLNARSRDTVFIELFDDKPLTQANFMEYVNGGRYNESFMHRLAKDLVIQGGGFYPVYVDEPAPVYISLDPSAIVDRDGNPATPNPTVTNEYALPTVRSNLRGTIAMARVGGQANSATNQWFVNLKDNSGLDSVDGGFTVFAKVLGDGMQLYDAINAGPPIYITNLNPDLNDDGVRDNCPSCPFGMAGVPDDGVPYLQGISGDLLVILEKAKRIDYYGAGTTTTVPSGGLNLSTRDAFVDSGHVFTGGTGPLIIGPGRTVGIREQISLGRGLINNGRFEPGLKLGSIVMTTFRNGSGGTFAVDLAGTTPDTGHDRIVVAGEAILAGRLDVSLINEFVPRVGNTFTIIAAGSFTGDFTIFELPMLSGGLVWDMNKTATTYSLSVTATDFNRNGIVDAADYVLWRKLRGTTTASAYGPGDATGDRLVTDADLAIWRANLGNIRGNTASGAGGLAAVPEPSGLLLLSMLGAAAVANRRVSAMFRGRASM